MTVPVSSSIFLCFTEREEREKRGIFNFLYIFKTIKTGTRDENLESVFLYFTESLKGFIESGKIHKKCHKGLHSILCGNASCVSAFTVCVRVLLMKFEDLV